MTVHSVGWSDRKGGAAGDDNCLFALARFAVVLALVIGPNLPEKIAPKRVDLLRVFLYNGK